MAKIKWPGILLAAFILSACSQPSHPIRFHPGGDMVTIENLTVCDETHQIADIEPARPLNVFVHGCNSSGGIEFRALARVFEFHGQQTLCFNYDDRESMEKSSARLIRALNALSEKTNIPAITVLGHSQGGLVSRRAFKKDRVDSLSLEEGTDYRLITISSPFAGIIQSADCGKTHLHLATLGITVAVCRMIAGEKWNELYPGSDFIANPGELLPSVRSHLKIVTDERNTCYRSNADGECMEDDFVFSVDEQYYEKVDRDLRLLNVEVKAGHSEIVGNKDVAPEKLIAILQANRILNETRAYQVEELERLLSLLY